MKRIYAFKKAATLKQVSVLLVFCLVGCLFFSAPISTAATYNPTVSKYALVMSAPYDMFVLQKTHNGMVSLFESYNITTYDHVHPVNGTVTAFKNQIITYLGQADSNDIVYLYINTHGEYDSVACESALGVGGQNSGNLLYMSELKECLDLNVDGHVILMIDACECGSAVGRGDGEAAEETPLSDLMVGDFFGTNDRSGEFVGDNRYTVFCSCLHTEIANSSPPSYSNAYYVWALGSGFNMVNESTCLKWADTNSDSIITVKELYDYSLPRINLLCYGQSTQTMCYYSASDRYSFFYIDPNGTDHGHPLGDVNQSESITTADANELRYYLQGVGTLTTRQKKLGDMNGDGSLSMADVLAINQYINSMI